MNCIYCDKLIVGRRKGALYCCEEHQRAMSQRRHRNKYKHSKDQKKMWVMEDIDKLHNVSEIAYEQALKLVAAYGHDAGDYLLTAVSAVVEILKPELLERL